MGFRNPILGGGGALVRPAIKSPNYQSGVAGWTINRAGNAEFNDLSVRGVFNGTSYVLNENGLYFYDPTPGPGNLVGAWVAEDGTDPYGNAVLAGLANYSGSEYVQMFDGNLVVGVQENPAAPFGPDPGLLGVTGDSKSVGLQSATSTAFPTQAVLNVVSGTAAASSGQAAYRHTDTRGDSWVTGTLAKSTVSGGVATPVTWQAPVYRSGWSGGSSAATRYQTLQYRIDAQDNLVLVGALHATAALAAGSYTLFTLTGDYVPKKLFGGMALQVSSADAYKDPFRLNVDNTGAVGINTPISVAAGDTFYINEIVPLGNLQ